MTFSDMTGMAINYYVRTALGYSWYWDGKIGPLVEAFQAIPPKPTRYFDDQP